MMMPTKLFVIACFLFLIPVVSGLEQFVGDTVFINTSQAYISATPHTMTGSGWVNVEFESKQHTLDVNILFGYNGDYLRARTLERYDPHTVTRNTTYECAGTFEYTTNPNVFRCYHNGTLAMEHHYDGGSIAKKTAWWFHNETIDWRPVNKAYTVIPVSHAGKNRWFLMQDIPLTAGVRYRARVWIDAPTVPIGRSQRDVYPEYDGKYDIAFFPATYGNDILGAHADGRLYVLDPTVNLTSGLVVYYPFDSNMSSSVGGYGSTTSGTVTISSPGVPGVASNASLNVNNAGAVALQVINEYGTRNVTVNFWVNVTSADAYDNIFSVARTSAPWAYQVGFNQLVGGCATSNDMLCFEDGGNNGVSVNFSTYFNKNTMITIRRFDNLTSELYINGEFKASRSYASFFNFSTGTIYFGRQSASTARYFNGRGDELAIWSRTLNTTEITELYNDGNATVFPFVTPEPPVVNGSVVFLNQTPSDITVNNLFGERAHVWYNISLVTGLVANASTPFMNWTVLNGRPFWSVVNGSVEYAGSARKPYDTNTSPELFRFFLTGHDVYPATYNVLDGVMRNALHSAVSLSTQNQYVKVELLNVSDATVFNEFEVMANSSNTTTRSLQVYYCNSTYTTGNPGGTGSCTIIGELGPTPSFDHQHNLSWHQIFPFTITGGLVNNVTVTSTSQFVLGVTGGSGSWEVWNISASSRPGASTTSTNGGVSWSAITGTFDAHLHQLNDGDVLSYQACGQNTTHTYCGSFINDTIDLVQQRPSTPIVTVPAGISYARYINITFLPSVPFNASSSISNYTLKYCPSLPPCLNTTITVLDNSTFSYFWDTWPWNLAVGEQYRVLVTATDTLNLSATGTSASFTMSTNSTSGVCGDGIVSLDEQCDNGGAANGACPLSCSASCTVNSCPVTTEITLSPPLWGLILYVLLVILGVSFLNKIPFIIIIGGLYGVIYGLSIWGSLGVFGGVFAVMTGIGLCFIGIGKALQ